MHLHDQLISAKTGEFMNLETLHADYEKRQLQHMALQQSEARYRDELSDQLEQRGVIEQMQTFERKNNTYET